MPFLPLYFQQLGVEDVGEIAMWSGLSLGVTPALTAFMAPFWGRLADRFGRKIMVERSLVSFVIVMAAMAFVTEPWHVFALRAIQGLFAGYGALTLTMAADSAPQGRMAHAIGLVQTAQRLGPALGPGVRRRAVAQMVGLRRAFLVTAGFYLIALVLVFVMYDEQAGRISGSPTSRGERPRHVPDVLAFENFVLLMAVIFGLQFVDRSFGPVLPLYVGAARHAGVEGSARRGRAVFHRGRRRRRRPPHLRAASAASHRAAGHRRSVAVGAIGALIYAFAPGPWMLLGGTVIFGGAIGVATTAAYTAASSIIPPTARGTGFGLLTTASLMGLAVSPIISGMLASTSIRAVFLLDAVGLLALAAMVSRLMVVAPLPAATTPATEEV